MLPKYGDRLVRSYSRVVTWARETEEKQNEASEAERQPGPRDLQTQPRPRDLQTQSMGPVSREGLS